MDSGAESTGGRESMTNSLVTNARLFQEHISFESEPKL
jgi:hypothetical protein